MQKTYAEQLKEIEVARYGDKDWRIPKTDGFANIEHLSSEKFKINNLAVDQKEMLIHSDIGIIARLSKFFFDAIVQMKKEILNKALELEDEDYRNIRFKALQEAAAFVDKHTNTKIKVEPNKLSDLLSKRTLSDLSEIIDGCKVGFTDEKPRQKVTHQDKISRFKELIGQGFDTIDFMHFIIEHAKQGDTIDSLCELYGKVLRQEIKFPE